MDSSGLLLLVEDNPADAHLVRELLRDDSDRLPLVHVERLGDAVVHLRQEQVACVLLDLSLPDSSGLEGLTSLWEHDPSVPIVVLTGQRDEEVGLEAVKHGAQDFLFKGRADGEAIKRSIRYAIERKKSEQALQQANERFATAFRSAATGMALMSPGPEHLGRFRLVNRALCELTGYREEALLGKHFAEITHPEDRKEELASIERLVKGEIAKYQLEKRFIRADGEPVWILLTASLLSDARGAPLYVFSQMQDISELKRAEQLKDEFFALVSHELRTPLTSVIGYLELLADMQPPDAARHFLEVAMRSSERLQRLVGDLLFMAELEAGRLGLEEGEVDLNAVVAEAVETAATRGRGQGITLELTAEQAAVCSGDRDRLAQVVDNLLSNALKYTPEGGKVDVTLRSDGGGAVIEVADNGVGIPAEEQSRLFERFFRASSATEQATPGVGLGLTIVKAIVEGHGGRISIHSEQDVGTTARVELPVAANGAGD